VLAAVLLVAGCTPARSTPGGTSASSPRPTATTSPASEAQRYVALGDSYSAGPLIPTSDLAGGCLRSDHNYPSLLARQLHVRSFRDVTCSGATTADLTHVQRTFGDARIPPQLDAVTKRTTLVTVGIGGNDLDLFTTLVSTCTRLRTSDPTGAPCTRQLATRGVDLRKVTSTISGNVERSLRAIRAKVAPGATVLLVGYLRQVPPSGTCAALPLATGDYAVGRRISAALNQALHRAAQRTGVRFVDMYAQSAGHDICSAHPWVNGAVTDRQRALAYHPFASGMRADAAGVRAALGR
jgi:lysophospholipase L1-like esterase